MSLEALSDQERERFNKFLEENYPVKHDAVLATIKFAEDHQTEVLTPQAYLLAQAGLNAKTNGISDIPVTLNAVWTIEKSLPEDERRLSAKDYVGLLMTGENTSANTEADQTGSIKDSYDHGERFLILFNFWQEL